MKNEKVFQVKFDGGTIWKVHAKLKYGEVNKGIWNKFTVLWVGLDLDSLSQTLHRGAGSNMADLQI